VLQADESGINMKSLLSKKLVIVGVCVAVLGGGAVAVAATRTSPSPGVGRKAYLDDLAKRLNVSPETLSAAAMAARDEQIEAAVASGRITAAQAAALKKRAERPGSAALLAVGAGVHPATAVAAAYLGIKASALRSDRRAGRSLAQIASSTPGKSVEGLKTALASADTQRVKAAENAGVITSQQEQQRVSEIPGRVERQITRTARARRRPRAAAGSTR
jgi:hypothetical protein